MKVHFDPEADVLYLRIDDLPIVESEEVSPGVELDFKREQQVVRVEILRVQERVPQAKLKQIEFEVA